MQVIVLHTETRELKMNLTALLGKSNVQNFSMTPQLFHILVILALTSAKAECYDDDNEAGCGQRSGDCDADYGAHAETQVGWRG